MWEMVEKLKFHSCSLKGILSTFLLTRDGSSVFYLSFDFLILPSLAENLAALMQVEILLEDYCENRNMLEHSFYSLWSSSSCDKGVPLWEC